MRGGGSGSGGLVAVRRRQVIVRKHGRWTQWRDPPVSAAGPRIEFDADERSSRRSGGSGDGSLDQSVPSRRQRPGAWTVEQVIDTCRECSNVGALKSLNSVNLLTLFERCLPSGRLNDEPSCMRWTMCSRRAHTHTMLATLCAQANLLHSLESGGGGRLEE